MWASHSRQSNNRMQSEKVIQRIDTGEYWLSSKLKWVNDISDATKFPSKYAAKQEAWAIINNHHVTEQLTVVSAD